MVVDTGTPEVKVFEYSVGGAFGELALLHGEPRQVCVFFFFVSLKPRVE